MSASPFHLFDAFGIEMEYMLVDAQSLNVRPVADQLLESMAGVPTGDVEVGPITWSNELALHVIELKTTDPAKSLLWLPNLFENAIAELKDHLTPLGLRLLPTAMHPWMDPTQETKLWPHEYSDVYQTYDRIFNCRQHGWSNVQSVHLNLPFSGDEEFAKLHAAVRILSPLLPALAASSPVIEGAYTGFLDSRMEHYARHCEQVPTLTGRLIPEPIYTEASYRKEIFESIRSDMLPHDPQGVMQVEFLNARGAIARFDRGSIELRLMDVQEYPAADVAICAGVTAVLRAMCQEKWSSWSAQQTHSTESLVQILASTSRDAERATIEDAAFLAHFGVSKSKISARRLWAKILSEVRSSDTSLDGLFAPLEVILESGSLASRIQHALGPDFSKERLFDVYRELADCLVRWESFQP